MSTTESITEVTPLSDRDLLGAVADMKGWLDAIQAEMATVDNDLRDHALNARRHLLRRNWLRGTESGLIEAIRYMREIKRHRP